MKIVLMKGSLMSHMTGSSVPMETENQVEEFITDMRGIIVGSSPVFHGGNIWDESARDEPSDGVSLFEKALYGRDRLIYQRVLRVGLALAGQVAFGGDIMME